MSTAGEIGAIVQARMTSEGLPGKVLRPLAGRPVLRWVLERLEHASGLGAVLVATSTESSDDPVADFCADAAVGLYRGPLEDVAGRMLGAADEHGLSAFVRVSADSALLDPRLVSTAIELFRETRPDLVSNVYPRRSFPVGQSVEVVRTEALRSAHAEMSAPADREHVTRFAYREHERFRIEGFANELDASAERLVVDDQEDLAALEAIIAAMGAPHWHYGHRELVELKRAAAGAG